MTKKKQMMMFLVLGVLAVPSFVLIDRYGEKEAVTDEMMRAAQERQVKVDERKAEAYKKELACAVARQLHEDALEDYEIVQTTLRRNALVAAKVEMARRCP